MKKILTFLFTIIAIAGFSQGVTVTIGEKIDSASNADLLQGKDTTYMLNRTNHTGTQAQSTINDMQDSLDAKADTADLHDPVNVSDSLKAGVTDSFVVNTNAFVVRTTGQIGVGIATPNASSLLHLNSTTTGFIPPRMTVAQRDAISSPANGLHIYATGAGVPNFYNGTAWRRFVHTAVTTLEQGAILIGETGSGVTCDSTRLSWDGATKTMDVNGNVDIDSTLRIDGDTVKVKPDSASFSDKSGDIHVISYTLSLRGVSDETVILSGDFEENVMGLTGDYATDWTVHNNHVFFRINSITGSDTILFTGTSVNETTSVPTIGDTEVVIVSATGQYETSKKWWEIMDIDIKSGISAINYDLGVLGYNDLNNSDYTIIGYRMSIYSQGLNGDIRFQLYAINDLGNDSLHRLLLEDIGVDANGAGDQIIDSLRTGSDDRSYNPTVSTIMGDDEMLIFKQKDFTSYFSTRSQENKIHAATLGEGFFIKLSGMPSGGITNIDHVSIELRYIMGVN